MARLTEKAVAEQIGKLRGNTSAIGRAFGVTRQAVAAYIGRRPALVDLLKDCREERVDNAESALDLAVLRGEAWAVCFTLKTQGKDRGYTERHEHTGKDGGAMEFKNVSDADLDAAIAAEQAALAGAAAGETPPPGGGGHPPPTPPVPDDDGPPPG